MDGDSWQSAEVPLGEASEVYRVRIMKNASVVRETVVTQQNWIYSQMDQAADGVAGQFEIEVAQVSETWGPGLFSRIIWNG